MDHSCPKCDALMEEADIVVPGSWISVRGKKRNVLMKPESFVTSYLCSKCGYIELYAKNPEIF